MRFASLAPLVASLMFACGGRSQDHHARAQGGDNQGGAASAAQGGRFAAGGALSGGAPGAQGGTDASGGASAVSGQWTLPQEPLSRWRNSAGALCSSEDGSYAWSVWSDAKTLYVTTLQSLPNSRLWKNSGAEWERTPTDDLGFQSVTGMRDGALLLYGGSLCGAYTYSSGVATCISDLPSLTKVMSAGVDRTFALAGDRLLHFNGSYFTASGISLPEASESWPVYQLWVGDDVLIAGGGDQVWIVGADGVRHDLSLPDGSSVRSLWASGANDIWVGGEEGLLAHYDGRDWEALRTGNCSAVVALWGTADALFLAGGSFFGRVQGGKLETIFDQPCVEIPFEAGTWEHVSFGALWGNSPTEVFVVVDQERYQQTLNNDGSLEASSTYPECGRSRLYWFDGARLSPL